MTTRNPDTHIPVRRYTIGTVPALTNNGKPTLATLTVEATIDAAGELHVTGETRRKGASDSDQGGQMQDSIREWLEAGEITYAPGWNDARVGRLLDTWDRWHLNHLRAGCEHQRAEWRTDEPLTIYTWTLDGDAAQRQREIKKDGQERLQAGETVTLDEEARALLALPYTIKTPNEQPPPHYESPRDGSPFGAAKETKTAGWVRPDEHPGGLLGKSCETCGYKYGSAWLREELPAEVVALVERGFLDAPEPDDDEEEVEV